MDIGGFGLVGNVPGERFGIGVGVDVLIGVEADDRRRPSGPSGRLRRPCRRSGPRTSGRRASSRDGRAEPAAGEHEHVDVFPVDRAEAVDVYGGVVGGRDVVEHMPGMAETQRTQRRAGSEDDLRVA